MAKVEVDVPCPQCGNPKMRVNNFRGRQFLGCTTYPKCKGTGKVTEEVLAMIAKQQGAVSPPA